MTIAHELCPRGQNRINPKKNPSARRPRHAYPHEEEYEQVSVGAGDQARTVLQAHRWDGAKLTKGSYKNPPSRTVSIPRKPIMFRDPYAGMGKHRRKVKQGRDAHYQERDAIRRRNSLAASGAEQGHEEKRRRAEKGQGKNTAPKKKTS